MAKSLKIRWKGKEFRYNKQLYDNILQIKIANLNDWDFKMLVSGDGMTRTGKSTIAAQTAVIVDPTVDLDRVIFKGDKLIETSLKVGKNKAIIYDEAREGLDSKKVMSTYSKRLVDYFSECGWLNQYLIIVLPDYFDLAKSIALNQSICLLNCYTRGNFERGNFAFYNRKDKRFLYIKGKKFNNYGAQRASFRGSFSSFFPFDKKEYEKRKLDNQKEYGEDDKEAVENPLMRASYILKTKYKLSSREIAECLNKSHTSINTYVKQFEQKLKLRETVESVKNHHNNNNNENNPNISKIEANI